MHVLCVKIDLCTVLLNSEFKYHILEQGGMCSLLPGSSLSWVAYLRRRPESGRTKMSSLFVKVTLPYMSISYKILQIFLSHYLYLHYKKFLDFVLV